MFSEHFSANQISNFFEWEDPEMFEVSHGIKPEGVLALLKSVTLFRDP
jgi:hypothetical protein